jgi:lysine 6-dehydrogenase
MRIFVLGAGRMGSAIFQDLVHTAGQDLEVGIGDVDFARATELAKSDPHGSGRPYKVDGTGIDELSAILEKYDAVVNATWYENNLHVMRACLMAGCHYNDLGGLFRMTRQQLLLDGDAKSRGISAIVGGGESPGITNVMCALAAEGMSKVEAVKIYAGAKETGQNQELVFPFSISTVIDEYTKRPVEYLNGEYTEVAPLSGDEVVTFPEPVGKNVCHYSIHSEPATLPATIDKGVRNVEFRLGISEKMIGTLTPLLESGMLYDEPRVPVNEQSISPRDFVISFFNSKAQKAKELERWVALKVVVTGILQNEKKVQVSCDLLAAPGSYGFRNATAFLTGVAGSIFGQYLAKGRIAKGVLAPEQAVDAAEFVAELESRGIKISKQVRHDDV